jgi:hypothetical protein
MGRRAQLKRSAGRAAAVAARKVARDRERLAHLAEGGTPERPIEVASPSLVEVVAASMPCPLCEASLRVLEHQATVIGGERLRVARTACSACRAERSFYFRLRAVELH